MKVTDVKVKVIDEAIGGRLKAYVDITLDDCFAVHGLKIVEGQNGLFISMPSKKVNNTEFKDIVHPINAEFRNELTAFIVEKYNEEKEKVSE